MIKLRVHTDSQVCAKNITSEINRCISNSGIQNGICYIFVPHTTAGIVINEKADPDVMKDVIEELNKIVPFDDNYRHTEGNSSAHIKSCIVGVSQAIPIENGQLALGIWQAVFLCEFDGPRYRNVFLTLIKE